MRHCVRLAPALLLLLLLAARADALCIYHGVYNAHTTIRREFADSEWVVRARVIAAADGEVERGPDAGMTWTAYWLEVVRAYKGRPPRRIRFFTERNSGGFYMDRPWLPLARAHNIGGEYLLFLYHPRSHPDVRASAGATFVNYSCGQSGPWRDVRPASRRLLEALSRRGR